jgi:hypothetical protein
MPLNKEICEKCSLYQAWNDWGLEKGSVWECKSFAMTIGDEPPEDCPFLLEHTVSKGKKWQPKKK